MIPFEKIIGLLNSSHLQYQLLEHEPVYTCDQASQVRDLPASMGMKTLLIKTNKSYVLVVLPGNKKLDSKKLKKTIGVSDLSFARPEIVKEIMGCEVGACYPFGQLLDLQTIVDPKIKSSTAVAFNPGRHDRTIIMNSADYLSITPHLMADISVN